MGRCISALKSAMLRCALNDAPAAILRVDLETRDDDFLMIGKRRMIASEVGSENERNLGNR